MQTGEGHVSFFNMQELRTVKDEAHPVYGDTTSTRSPIKFKDGDRYVGVAYCDLPDQKLADILPADDHFSYTTKEVRYNGSFQVSKTWKPMSLSWFSSHRF